MSHDQTTRSFDLRPTTTGLVRTRLIDRIVEGLKCGRSFALRGAHGLGKTSIGLAVREQLAAAGHRVFHTSLYLHDDGTRLFERICDEWSIPARGDESLFALLKDAGEQRDKPKVVILDEADLLPGLPPFVKHGLRELAQIGVGVLICVADWRQLVQDAARELTSPFTSTFCVLDILPLSQTESVNILRACLPTIPTAIADGAAALAGGNPRLLNILGWRLQSIEAERGSLETLSVDELSTTLWGTLEPLQLDPARVLPFLDQDCVRLWQDLDRYRVVQLPKIPQLTSLMLNCLASKATQVGYTVHAEPDIPTARHLEPHQLYQTVFGTEAVNSALGPHRSVLPEASVPGQLSQREWGFYDSYYGHFYRQRPSAPIKKLLVLEPGEVGEWLAHDRPYHWLDRQDLAELIALSLSDRCPEGLRVLLISNQDNLTETLASYQLRPTPEGRPFARFPIGLNVIRGGLPVRPLALAAAIGDEAPVLEILDRLLADAAPESRILAESLRALCRPAKDRNAQLAENPFEWAVPLRRLRIANLLSFHPPLLPDGHDSAAQAAGFSAQLPAWRTAPLISQLCSHVEVKVGIGMFTGAHHGRGAANRLRTLLGLTPAPGGGSRPPEGFLRAWVEDLKLCAVDSPYSHLPQYDPEGERRAAAARAREDDAFSPRVAELLRPFDVACRDWLDVVVAIEDATGLYKWASSVGLGHTPTREEATAFLFALEARTPMEYRVAWLGREPAPRPATKQVDGNAHPKLVPAEAATSKDQPPDMLNRLDAGVQRLLGDQFDRFRTRCTKGMSGTKERCFREWLIGRRWLDEIARSIGQWMGQGTLVDRLEELGIPFRENEDPQLLVEHALEDCGCPRAPRVRGARTNITELLHAIRSVPGQGQPSPRDIHSLVVQMYQVCETACMEIVIANAEAYAPYRTRVLAKLSEGSRKGSSDDWHESVLQTDLGRLNMLVHSLTKRIERSGPWCEEFRELRPIEVKGNRIHELIDSLRRARPPWAHGGHERDLAEKAVVPRELFEMFIELCETTGFQELLPPLVEVVAIRTDPWGGHAEVFEELRADSFVVYRVNMCESSIMRQFYLISPTNPTYVEPILVPRAALRKSPPK